MAGGCTKAPAEGGPSCDDIPDEYRWETSLPHITRTATEAQSRATAEWVSGYIEPERRYRPRPPSGGGLRRKHVRRTRKSLAGRCYQPLSGHAAIWTYLMRIKKTDTSDCWWCDSGEQQSRHHLFTRCRALVPLIRRLWKDIGKACG